MKKLHLILRTGLLLFGSLLFIQSFSQEIINGTWDMQANGWRGQNNQRFTIRFPAGGTLSTRVWGTGTYTDDCSIASAAVHAGLITPATGGTVTIEIRPGQTTYTGSEKYGVKSHDWGAFDGSFIFVSGNKVTTVIDLPVINADWNTQLNAYERKPGQLFRFYFPPNGTVSSRLWGTDIYTDDGSIASAAVHAGLITKEKGGTVTVRCLEGQDAYKGSVRNGVKSGDWGGYGGSFRFEAGQVSTVTTLPSNVIRGDWTTQLNAYERKPGQRFTFYFPAGGTLSSRVWGTDIYTDDCSVATAAVHAGLITREKGGTVTIEVKEGQAAYKGTLRNGVQSNDWGGYGGSFVFVR